MVILCRGSADNSVIAAQAKTTAENSVSCDNTEDREIRANRKNLGYLESAIRVTPPEPHIVILF